MKGHCKKKTLKKLFNCRSTVFFPTRKKFFSRPNPKLFFERPKKNVSSKTPKKKVHMFPITPGKKVFSFEGDEGDEGNPRADEEDNENEDDDNTYSTYERTVSSSEVYESDYVYEVGAEGEDVDLD